MSLSVVLARKDSQRQALEFPDVLTKIVSECGPMVDEVVRNAKRTVWGYRGEDFSPIFYDQSLPDLLLPETYGFLVDGDSGPKKSKAAAFFSQMDDWLSKAGYEARPSNSHIMAGSKALAAVWGKPSMIFPRGAFSFVWLRKSQSFFVSPDWEKDLWWEDTNKFNDFMESACSEDLEEALSQGHEVMFKSDGFYAISDSFEKQLWLDLKSSRS